MFALAVTVGLGFLALRDQVQAQAITARRREVAELHQLLAQTALNVARRPWWKLW